MRPIPCNLNHCPRYDSSSSNQLTSAEDEDPHESRYLGKNSIAAFLSEESHNGESVEDGEHDVIRKDIMPILGLQSSSASYPFMSTKHLDKIRQDIGASLPADRDVLKLAQTLDLCEP